MGTLFDDQHHLIEEPMINLASVVHPFWCNPTMQTLAHLKEAIRCWNGNLLQHDVVGQTDKRFLRGITVEPHMSVF